MSLTSYMRDFVRDYDLMAIRPRTGTTPLLKGRFAFIAHHPQIGEIEDAFDLEIDVPPNFPRELPRVIETGSRIPRTGFYHVNQRDRSLCLGSPLRLRVLLASKPSLVGFAETCLVPFLAGVSYKLKTGKPLPFGELNHGAPGALNDYQVLFEVETPDQALAALRLLGKKKRIANKLPCPCGCGVRLGRCGFRDRLIRFRALANRPWYRLQFQEMSREFEIVAKRKRATVREEIRPYGTPSSVFPQEHDSRRTITRAGSR